MLRNQRQTLMLRRELAEERQVVEHAKALVQRLLVERDEAITARDDALAELADLRGEALAGDTDLWRAMADRSSDEATAYCRQLVAAGIAPDRDFGTPQQGQEAPSW